MNRRKQKIIITLALLMLIIACIPVFYPIAVEGRLVPYNYTIHGNYIEINKYKGTEAKVEIPAYLWFRPVKEISEYRLEAAFDLDYVTQIKMPNTITTITGPAFIRCWNLEKITLSDNIEIIPDECFAGCEKLREVVLSKNVKEIVGDAFVGCTSLERVVFYNPQTQIDEEAFADTFSSCNFDILTLVSAKDSAVEKYAKEHGIKWEELEE